MAFNGLGTTSPYMSVGGNDTLLVGGSIPSTIDTLTPVAEANQGDFYWVSHTFSHANLDAIDEGSAAIELSQNNAVASSSGFTHFSIANLVQPDVSGLANGLFLRAAQAAGVRYLVSDTSKPGQDNPLPNIGRFSQEPSISQGPSIFVIPRRANNLFFNVATPADWTAEYNCIYRAYWGRDLTYPEILDNQSDLLAGFLFRGELNPWMFHQTNLSAYDGTRSLIGDLLDATFEKYGRFMTLPVLSPTMDALGARMANRTRAALHGVTGRIVPGGIKLWSPVRVTVPVTGIKRAGVETYGGQSISWITIEANVSSFFPLIDQNGMAAPVVDAGPQQAKLSLAQVTLTGTATDSNTPPRDLSFRWTQTAGPTVTLTAANQRVATFIAPLVPAGSTSVVLGFTLTAGNGFFDVNDTTTVVVSMPIAPTVSVGKAQTVNSNSAVTLSGAGADLNTPKLPLTFRWVQTTGPVVTLSNANAPSASFVAPALPVGGSNVVLGFTLTVSNGARSTSKATTVTVRAPRAGR